LDDKDNKNIQVKELGIINIGGFMTMNVDIWCAPKLLIRPKKGLSYSNNGIVRNSGYVLSSQH
jgi:hypothetical protein